MIIDKLIISAFGPYREVEEVDFSKLGKSGIYLITGDTGSGKTTIFDAISFALFGEPSGSARNSQLLRCKESTTDFPTYAELYFTCHGKKIRIKRDPGGYAVKSSRKSGNKNAESKAELECEDGIYTKIKEIDQKITSILGINREQFSKIIMLAQGEFKKLLLDNTANKSQIFRTLFSTEIFDRIQQEIKNDALKKKSDFEAKDAIYRSHVRSVAPSDSFSITDGTAYSDIDEHIAASIDEAEDALISLDKKKTLLDIELKKAIDRIAKADEYEKKSASLASKNLELSRLESKMEKAEENLRILKELDADSAEKERRKLFLETNLEEFSALDKSRKNLSFLEEDEAEAKEAIEKSRSEIEELKASIASDKKEAEELSDAKLRAQSIRSEREKNSAAIQDVENLQGKLSEAIKASRLYKTAQKEYLDASECQKSSNEDYQRKMKAFLDNQAGILASTLLEGEPCPVCGSTSHPSPAALTSSDITEEELNDARDKAECASDEAKEKSTEAAVKKAELEAVKTEVENLSCQIFGSFDPKQINVQIAERKNGLEDEKSALLDALDIENRREERRTSIINSLPEEEKRKDDLEAELNSKIAECTERTLQIAVEKSTIERISSKLGDASKDKAEKEISTLTFTLSKRKKAKEDAENALKGTEESRALLKGEIKAVMDYLASNEELSRDEEEDREKDIKATLNSVQNAITTTTSDRNELITLRENLKTSYEARCSAESEYSRMYKFASILNGSASNTDRISLEAYVQAYYYERILIKANMRLMGMTNGQYELRRKAEKSGGNSKSGLDTTVYDHYSGSERDVSSLSGGETFLASLALALGLSDEVESTAGGIEISSLFIDEGFGSLDDECLRRALSALSELSKTDKKIGLISHVQELKDAIDDKIIIKKDPIRGSRIELEV